MSELPLFPLRTVLFPGGLLPLRIFEPRYVDMVGRCMRESGPFGVLLIREGGEVGPVGELASIGTAARIIDFETLPGGLLGLLCRGERRFRVHSRRQQDDGLHLGECEWLPEPPRQSPLAEHALLLDVLRRVIAEYGAMRQHLQPDFDDADWVSCRLAELLPLPREQQQQLLEMNDGLERLNVLAPLIEAPTIGR